MFVLTTGLLMHDKYCVDCMVIVCSFFWIPVFVKCMAGFWLIGLVGVCYLMHPGVIT